MEIISFAGRVCGLQVSPPGAGFLPCSDPGGGKIEIPTHFEREQIPGVHFHEFQDTALRFLARSARYAWPLRHVNGRSRGPQRRYPTRPPARVF